MKSRQDAANARAPELQPEQWAEAQRRFGDAIRLLERGDLRGAQRRAIEATELYRNAELDAIKDQYLSETRRLLAEADRARVGRYAPITLGREKQLLAERLEQVDRQRVKLVELTSKLRAEESAMSREWSEIQRERESIQRQNQELAAQRQGIEERSKAWLEATAEELSQPLKLTESEAGDDADLIDLDAA